MKKGPWLDHFLKKLVSENGWELVIPDSTKFCNFGKILRVFGTFSWFITQVFRKVLNQFGESFC